MILHNHHTNAKNAIKMQRTIRWWQGPATTIRSGPSVCQQKLTP